MCGIAGFVSTAPNRPYADLLLQRMCRTLAHRGPDDEGYYRDPYAGLAVRRLSVIDLVTGRQPMTNEDETLQVIFNGELYNYRDLRTTLIARGHTFATQSDTEIVVHAYEEFGDQCLEHFNGMFSFALWDTRRRRLLLARDRIGIKPLYYWQDSAWFVFGSELKALLVHPALPREIDLAALDHFLTLEYIPSPHTIYAGVHKLLPGHRLIFEDHKVRIERYWEIPVSPVAGDDRALSENLAHLIRDAVRMQLASDVPLGALLSGGIDSSTVVAAMCQESSDVRTFSIGFGDKSYDESANARAVASHFGTRHEEQVLEPEIAGLAQQIVTHFDEPFADFSLFPTYLVSKLARQSVTVALSGDGGDELFGGYDTYVAQQAHAYYRVLPASLRTRYLPALTGMIPPQPAKKGPVNKLKRFVEGAALPEQLQHTRWMMFLSESERRALYTPETYQAAAGNTATSLIERHFAACAGRDPLAQQQCVDIGTYLVDGILTKVDRMSMAVSLEVRVPLLDHRIVEFAVNLPPRLKLQGKQTKAILRKAMTGRLPASVLTKPKQGFSMPMKHWLQSSLRPMMLDLLSPDVVRRRGYFAPNTVQRWVADHLAGRANHSHRLWALLVFELWHRQIHDAPKQMREPEWVYA